MSQKKQRRYVKPLQGNSCMHVSVMTPNDEDNGPPEEPIVSPGSTHFCGPTVEPHRENVPLDVVAQINEEELFAPSEASEDDMSFLDTQLASLSAGCSDGQQRIEFVPEQHDDETDVEDDTEQYEKGLSVSFVV